MNIIAGELVNLPSQTLILCKESSRKRNPNPIGLEYYNKELE
jgi:hypothetical protein